jgi:hypothetical protein
MAPTAASTLPSQFDDRNIQWRALGDFPHLVASIFFVDEEQNIVDFVIKFDPNEKVLLHRHLAATTTFVVDGEHRIYEPDGQLREVRPVGRYTFSTANDPHNEGGGPTGGIVYFNVRGTTEALFDVLDADLNVVATLRTGDFKAAFDAQQEA